MHIMKINNTNYSHTFGIKFKQNSALEEVEKYVKGNKNYKEAYDLAMQRLSKAEKDVEVTIENKVINGKTTCSKFVYGDTSVENSPYDSEPVIHATYRAIIDLSIFDGRYRALFNL